MNLLRKGNKTMKVITIEKLRELAGILEDNKIVYEADSSVGAIDLLVDLADATASELTLSGGAFVNELDH